MKTLLYVLGATVMLSPVGAIAQERGDSRLTASLSIPPLELQSVGCPNPCGPKDASLLMGNSDDSRRSDLIGAVVGAGIGFALTWGACASAEVCTDGLVVVGALVGGLVGAGIGSRIGDDADPGARGSSETLRTRRLNERRDLPAAPSELTATDKGYAQIDLTWIDNATDEDGFRIERREGQAGEWVKIGSVGPDRTEYSDLSSEPDTEYCYRVVAFTGEGESARSDESCASWS